MRKILMILVVSASLILTACGAETVKETVIDKTHTEAYTALETDYKYKYDMWKGEFVLLPYMGEVTHPETWMVTVEVLRDDGFVYETTREVTKEDYENIKIGDVLMEADRQ